jgi:phosphoribosylaminoimidazole carboxylase
MLILQYMYDLGVLGGGQLGRMLALAAHRLGLAMVVLDPLGQHSPAGQVTCVVQGHYADPTSVQEFAASVPLVTYEIEHVDVSVGGLGHARPGAEVIKVVQDKLEQKRRLIGAGVETTRVVEILQDDRVRELGGFPVMVKSRRMAYDGKGNFLVRDEEQMQEAMQVLAGELYAEEFVEFQKEVAVMVFRGIDGKVGCFPVVETIQRNNVCDMTIMPSGLEKHVEENVVQVAMRAVECLGNEAVGIFGVEMFVTKKGKVLVNEIAPRPHNSGHYTIEACFTDQFEQHLRMVLGLAPGDSRAKVPFAAMINVLGDGNSNDPTGVQILQRMRSTLQVQGASMHWYGKSGNKAGRKLGHVTILAESKPELDRKIRIVREMLHLE